MTDNIYKRIVNIPGHIWFHILVAGTAIGIGLFSLQSGGGYDAYFVFLSGDLETVPPWVHMFLAPLTWFNWPLSYGILSSIAWVSVAFASRYFGGKWWLAVFSLPCIWEIWSGQIDWMIIIGMVLAVKVINQDIWPGWLGLSWALLLVKPWIGASLVGLTFFLGYQALGWKSIIKSATVFITILILSFIYSPNWLEVWLIPFIKRNIWQFSMDVRESDLIAHPAMTNGALWPWGILSWIMVLGSKDKQTKMRRFLAATLLSLPYLRFYHVLPLIVVQSDETSEMIAFGICWFILVLVYTGVQWASFAWVLPLFILVYDRFFSHSSDQLQLTAH